MGEWNRSGEVYGWVKGAEERSGGGLGCVRWVGDGRMSLENRDEGKRDWLHTRHSLDFTNVEESPVPGWGWRLYAKEDF